MVKSCIYIIFIFIIIILNIKISYAGSLYIEEQISGDITDDGISAARRILIKDNDILIEDPSFAYKTLFKINDKKAFLIDDLNRRYAVTGIQDFRMPLKEKFVPVFDLFRKSEPRHKESGNIRKIGKYDCFEVVLFLPRAAALINLWLIKNIEAPVDLYFSFLDRVKVESSQIESVLKIMREYKAYPAECIITMAAEGDKKKYFRIVLKEISAREIPASEFAVPEEYSRFVLK